MTSEPLIRSISSDEMDPLIHAFLDDCQLANLSPRTIHYYRGNLERFRWWCIEFGIPLDPALHTKHHLRQFLRYVQEAENRWGLDGHQPSERRTTQSTQQAYYATLRRFYNWLVREEEYLERSPLETIRQPRRTKDQPDPFNDDELARLARALDESAAKTSVRDRALVAVLLDVGLRVSELCALRLDDVDITMGDIAIVQGKGGKSRTVRLGNRGRRAVRRYWLTVRREDGPGGPFFLTHDGRPISRNSVRLRLDKLGQQAGVKPNNPHRYRHTAAVNAIRAGMNLFLVQYMLGHESLEMTRRYAKLADADMAEAARYSALDHLGVKL